MAINEKSVTSSSVTSKETVPAIIWGGAPERRWVLNPESFNPELKGMHVRFNSIFKDDECIRLMKDSSFVSQVRYINTVKHRACAYSGDRKFMSVGVPDAQLNITSSGSGATTQDTSIAGAVDQLHELLARATRHEAVRKAAHNAQISGYTVNGDSASFSMTCANGDAFTITVKKHSK